MPQQQHILSSEYPGSSLAELTYSEHRFEVIETLRSRAIAQLDSSQRSRSRFAVRLAAEESAAILAQYKRTEEVLTALLDKEGRLDRLTSYTRLDDPDLPSDPAQFADPAFAFQYCVKRLYRRQFETTVNEQKDGAWPLLLADLLDPLDGKRTLHVDLTPEALHMHSSEEFAKDLPLERVIQMQQTFMRLRGSLADRLSRSINDELAQAGRSKYKLAREVIVKLLDWAGRLEVAVEGFRLYREAVNAAKEAAAKAAAEYQAKRAWKETFGSDGPRELRGSSDHCDQFEKNREVISRTC